MGMFVFLLIFLFWVGALAASKTSLGVGIGMALLLLLGTIGSAFGQGIPPTHFVIILLGSFGVAALVTAVAGVGRAANGEPGAWTMFSWSVSLAAFPLVGWNALDMLAKAWS